MSQVLDESLVATAVAVAFKLSLDLETGSEERTSPLEKTGELTLFGGAKASLQSCSVLASIAGTNEAAMSRLEPSTQVALSGKVDEKGPNSEGISSGISPQPTGRGITGPVAWLDSSKREAIRLLSGRKIHVVSTYFFRGNFDRQKLTSLLVTYMLIKTFDEALLCL